VPPGQQPQPGDLIVWDEHIGLVERVDPNGTVHTIEGNSSDQVIRRTHAAGSALGYVRVG
jgi:YD repeat-containing protein